MPSSKTSVVNGSQPQSQDYCDFFFPLGKCKTRRLQRCQENFQVHKSRTENPVDFPWIRLLPASGITEAGRRGWQKIILECDAADVIRSIKAFPKTVDLIASDIRCHLNSVQSWQVQHVNRDANYVACHLPRWVPPRLILKVYSLFLTFFF